MRVLPICNRKGGVGKTATAANLGHALALRGRRVLVIDWDPQANLTTHIGRDDRPEDAPTIADVFLAPSRTTEAVSQSVASGVDLIYGSTALAEAERQILVANHSAPGLILTRILKRLEPLGYDYVLVDSPNGDGQLVRNALIAAPELLVPLQTEYAGMEGLGILRRLVHELVEQDALQERPKMLVFAAMVDERTRSGRSLKELALQIPGTSPLRSVVHRNAPIHDAYGAKQTVFDYARSSRGATEYAALAEEIDHDG
ncbi:ParA family protein [bacterium]|nr:MAG: ParA family protein [bacterium]